VNRVDVHLGKMDVKIEARIFWGDKHFRSPGFPFLHHELGTPREWCSALPLRSVDVQRGVRWTSKSAFNRTEESFTSSCRYCGSVPEISSTEEMQLRNGGTRWTRSGLTPWAVFPELGVITI
jgi:hypothetical protein